MFREFLEQKSIPLHKFTWTYHLSLLCFFLFLIEIFSGALLSLNYNPGLTATQSVELISRLLENGFLIRNIHNWASSIMIGLLMITTMSLFWAKSYKKPRALTWIFWLTIVFLSIFLAYSGHILPWNELAVSSTKVSMGILSSSTEILPAPLNSIGPWLAELMMAGSEISIKTLTRFYALHVSILPFSLTALFMLHLLLVFKYGLSSNELEIKKYISIKSFFYKNLAYSSALLFIVLFLGLTLPFDSFLHYPLKLAYDPLTPEALGVRPEWYMLFISRSISFFSQNLVQLILGFAALLLLAAPIVFAQLNRLKHLILILAFIIYFLIFTLMPVSAFPEFQAEISKNKALAVDCAYCHNHPQGPKEPPIMNKFGEHLIQKAGYDAIYEGLEDFNMLIEKFRDSDFDQDGISDAEEMLDASLPFDALDGHPLKLMLANTKKHLMQLLFWLSCTLMIVFAAIKLSEED